MPSESPDAGDAGELVLGKRRSKPSQKVLDASIAIVPCPKRGVGRPRKVQKAQGGLAAGGDLVVNVRFLPWSVSN